MGAVQAQIRVSVIFGVLIFTISESGICVLTSYTAKNLSACLELFMEKDTLALPDYVLVTRAFVEAALPLLALHSRPVHSSVLR